MKIKTKKEDLLKALSIVGRAVSTKTTEDARLSVTMETKDETKEIRLTTRDLEFSAETRIPAEILGNGFIMVKEKLLQSLIKSTKREEVLISRDDNGKSAKIKSGSTSTKMTLAYSDRRLEEIAIKNAPNISVNSTELKRALKKTLFIINKNATNIVLRGEGFLIDDNNLQLTAVESTRIGIATVNISKNNIWNMENDVPDCYKEKGKINFVLPYDPLRHLIAILPDDEETTIYIMQNEIIFSFGKTKLSIRVLNKKMLDVEALFSRSKVQSVLTLNKEDLTSTLERTSLFFGNKTGPLVFESREDVLNATLLTDEGGVNDDIPGKFTGDKIREGFNPNLMKEIISSLDKEEVTLQFCGPRTPCMIRENDLRYLLLPTNLR